MCWKESCTQTWCTHRGTPWWKNNKGVVGEDFLLVGNERTCVKCQSTKSVHKKKFRLYGPFLIPLGPFESVSMDFMTCLLEWEGMNAIFVAVDKFLKLMKFAPTQTNAITVGMTKLFFNMWVWHNGMLTVTVNDWDVKFTSKIWMMLMKKTNIK